ncbi:hypothetical protein, partial [Hoeflea sp.]|uniref:hypothetical protein n=1 Tax=Hoeflea sp. TaxID=1940281 RepID=UPI0025B8D551
TVASIQVLERAGDLAGVSMGQIEQATVQLTRRLSQAASGTGPAVDALDRLRLSAKDLHDFGVMVSDQDARQIERTNDAISRLGLIWRGVSNQLAVAAAPALEAVAKEVWSRMGLALDAAFANMAAGSGRG